MKTRLNRGMSVSIMDTLFSALFSMGIFGITFIFLCISSILIVSLKNTWSPAVVGLVLTQIMDISPNISWLFWTIIWNEGVLVSFERLLNYTELPQ